MSQIYLASKEEAKEQVLEWIRRSFVHQAGQSIPRKEAHERYLAWCAQQKIEPTTQAVFGKLLCEVFGEIKSRRLGSRDSSMMYYSDFYYSPAALAWTAAATPAPPPTQATSLSALPTVSTSMPAQMSVPMQMAMHYISTPYVSPMPTLHTLPAMNYASHPPSAQPPYPTNPHNHSPSSSRTTSPRSL